MTRLVTPLSMLITISILVSVRALFGASVTRSFGAGMVIGFLIGTVGMIFIAVPYITGDHVHE